MKIEIFSDYSCPFCYIGKTILEDVVSNDLKNEKVEIVYRAFQLDPKAPRNTSVDLFTHFTNRKGMTIKETAQSFAAIAKRGDEVGINIDFAKVKPTNTFDAHRLVKWARKYNSEQALSQALFKAYFSEGKNVSDFDTLLSLVESLNLNVNEAKSVLESDDYKDVVIDELNYARELEINSVPMFVINEQYGIKGAQPRDYFVTVLKDIASKSKKLEITNEELATCDVNGCN